MTNTTTSGLFLHALRGILHCSAGLRSGSATGPTRFVGIAGILLVLIFSCGAADGATQTDGAFIADLTQFAAYGDRSTGTAGCRAAAAYIREQFETLELESVATHAFTLPLMRHEGSRLELPDRQVDIAIEPVLLNAITPQTIPPEGLKGPLFYVGPGELRDFNGKNVDGAIVLMDIDSGRNWLNAANLGARALIYLDPQLRTSRMLYEDKIELSPIQFPRFRMTADQVRRIFGDFEKQPESRLSERVHLYSKVTWQEVLAENVYGLIPGSDPELKDEVVIVEAFYDSTAHVPGLSPGADEALGIGTLLELARSLHRQPPGRSVLLVATAGHTQTLAGMREMVWSIAMRSKDLRDSQKELKRTMKQARDSITLLERAMAQGLSAYLHNPPADVEKEGVRLLDAMNDRVKTEVDVISRRLMRLRLENGGEKNQEIIKKLAEQRFRMRRIGWRTDLKGLSAAEQGDIERLMPLAVEDYRRKYADAEMQEKVIRSAKNFRSLARAMEIATVVSLHLSSHGDGFGAFNYGWLYTLRPRVNRTANYSILDEVLKKGAAALTDQESLYRDTLRPSRLKSWQSYFLDQPPLGGEVSAMAGHLGFTLVTVNDARPLWGTPDDRIERVDHQFAVRQKNQVITLVDRLTRESPLHGGDLPRDGFATVNGRAKFLRHGELFPDQPAPGTVIMAFQGPGRYYSMVDSMGNFHLKGVATKKLVPDKVIIEGYRFDPVSGETVWAIDKKETGKDAYRLKIQHSDMETNMVMFGCKQTTIFSLLEPRSFRYMTKIQLIDGRREAKPVRYWWSRIDTWSSTIASVFLEPGTPMKMTLSDTVLRNKLILINADREHPDGIGFLVDNWPFIHRTDFKVADDMWTLLGPRIRNLERHGIYNERIAQMQREGLAALENARQALDALAFDRFTTAATRSWALATRVYNDVEDTQKDVLFGVLFYIALFVPFTFCMERLLFSYSNIHKRIIAFCSILILLIAVIYNVHPAFKLAYSPTVVILAFFIMGLSFIVTLIIYFRFEEEMTRLQRRARQIKAAEIGRWKAFTAAFLLGVSNLKRRRLRTALTCITLIILTFTVMSFTSVKSMRHHARFLFQNTAPYQGYLFKNVNWTDLPDEALEIIAAYFEGRGITTPRVWLEDQDLTRTLNLPVRFKDRVATAAAVVGLSAEEKKVTGLDRILTAGRWLEPTEPRTILLPERLAGELGIDPRLPEEVTVKLWGIPFSVVGIFSGQRLMENTDLDGEPLTSVTFPSEVSLEMTEVEMEALESGEEVRTYQSRYQHTDGELTVILPFQTLMSFGGKLKDIAVKPENGRVTQEEAEHLVDRFALTLFTGEPGGIFLYQASDTLSYSGVPNVVIPLVISVFIVLNTMIGSVYERKKEIGIYTSVGLAPSHVAFLFVAEALAFAVLSVVLGYLVAQTSASAFAGTALWAGITVNYSSLAGVAAMALVILVVLVSVIYPARVAAEIAIPDVNRSWKMPDAVDNRLEVTLPFLMNFREHLSIGGFLLDHFENHRDVSHGLFSAGEIDFSLTECRIPSAGQPDGDAASEKDAFLQMATDIWLAPFDFGIMQKVSVAFCRAAEDPAYLEIRMRLERLAGEANAWKRINMAFLLDLRKQLLIWRSLDASSKDHYAVLIAQKAEAIGLDLDTYPEVAASTEPAKGLPQPGGGDVRP